jgi:cbb3-type cytochrome oxidase subunit 3
MSAHSTGPSTITAREVPVYEPPPEALEEIKVRRAELRRIWKLVHRLGNPVESAATWAHVWLGVGVTAALSLLVLLGTNPVQVSGSRMATGTVKTWVNYAIGSVLFIGVFLAIFCWWFDHQNKRREATDKDLVLRELESIDPECGEPRSPRRPIWLVRLWRKYCGEET